MITLKNMAEENINQEFRLKNITVGRNYFIQKLKQNELISNIFQTTRFNHTMIFFKLID